MADQDTLFLKPAEGRRVRHPDGRLLDAAGEAVAASSYWTRLLLDEDVEDTNPPKAAKAPDQEKAK